MFKIISDHKIRVTHNLLKFFVNILTTYSGSKTSQKLGYISVQQKMCVLHCLQIQIKADENQGRAHPGQTTERKAN